MAVTRAVGVGAHEHFAAFRLIADSYPDGALLIFDTDLRYVVAGGAGLADVGLSQAMVEGHTIWECLSPEICAELEPRYRAALRGESSEQDVVIGSRIWVSRIAPIRAPDAGQVIGGLVCRRDATEERRETDALRDAEDRFRVAFDNAHIGMAIVGVDGQWLSVNKATCAITGYSEAELQQRQFDSITHPDDRDADREQKRMLLTGEIASYEIEKRYYNAKGEIVWVLLAGSLVRDRTGEPRYYVAQIHDITDRKQQDDQLRHLAETDGLTGLANRRSFDLALEREWKLTARDGIDSIVIVADLDGFKALNDARGHAAGDEALRQFSQALRATVRDTDVVGRIGGDEFAVILVRCGGEPAAIGFDARLREQLAALGWCEDAGLGVSLGHQSLRRSRSPQEALHRADVAMLEQKPRR